MNGTWVTRMLLSIAERPAANRAEVEPEPIEPGAWAEWARERARARPGTIAPRDTRVAPGHIELTPAVYPRGYGLRWHL